MLYDVSKEVGIETLKDKLINTSNSIQFLFNEGYIPNKNKYVILTWSNILIRVYKELDSFTKSQQNKIHLLYHRVMSL